MKFKPTDKAGGVMVELGPKEAQLPILPEFKLKKVLVPMDFSSCSKKALAYAIPFTRQFGAELTLLHVLHSYLPVPEMGPVDVPSIEDARKELDELQGTVGAALPSQTVSKALRVGEPYVEIIAEGKERDVDLIILSTHGRTGLTRVLLGSTAEKVVRHAHCPVLVVREREREFVAGTGLER